jgi:hypothetical protein
MSADRLSGWQRHWFRNARPGLLGVDDGRKESAVVDSYQGAVQLQLTVWEQQL